MTHAAPLSEQDWLAIGGHFASQKQWPKALWCYKNLSITLDRLINETVALIKIAHPEAIRQALSKAEHLIWKYPNESTAWDAAGNAAIAAVDFDLAAFRFAKARQLAPKRPDHIVNLAYVYQMLQRWDDAESLYIEAIQIDPLKVELRTYYGMLKMLRGDWETGLMNYDARLLHANPLPQNGKPIWQGNSY